MYYIGSIYKIYSNKVNVVYIGICVNKLNIELERFKTKYKTMQSNLKQYLIRKCNLPTSPQFRKQSGFISEHCISILKPMGKAYFVVFIYRIYFLYLCCNLRCKCFTFLTKIDG